MVLAYPPDTLLLVTKQTRKKIQKKMGKTKKKNVLSGWVDVLETTDSIIEEREEGVTADKKIKR